MTREEAIKQMEEFMVIDDWSLVYLPDLHDALELAIEALTENESLAKTVIEASELLRKQRPHGTCKTCKHYVKGGLDGKTYVCEHPNIEQDDYYNYACLMVEENDFCSSYEAIKKEGGTNEQTTD